MPTNYAKLSIKRYLQDSMIVYKKQGVSVPLSKIEDIGGKKGVDKIDEVREATKSTVARHTYEPVALSGEPSKSRARKSAKLAATRH